MSSYSDFTEGISTKQSFLSARNITVLIFVGAMIATVVMVFVWDLQRVLDKNYDENTVCGEDPGGSSDHKKAYDKCKEYKPKKIAAYARMGTAGVAGIGLLGYAISRNSLKNYLRR